MIKDRIRVTIGIDIMSDNRNLSCLLLDLLLPNKLWQSDILDSLQAIIIVLSFIIRFIPQINLHTSLAFEYLNTKDPPKLVYDDGIPTTISRPLP